MTMSRKWAALAASCVMLSPLAAVAADSTLVVVLGGEAYDGPPKFSVDFGGKPVGEGTVAAAIDTAGAGRFADAADKTPYIQTFTFSVPEAQFAADGEVRIKFLNEAYGGDGSNRDRTLYVASVSVNGRAVTASGLVSEAKSGAVPNDMLGEFLVLPDGTRDALSKAPQGGWPAPVDAVATGATQTVAVAVPPPAVDESLETAALDPDPESAQCDLDQKYNVIGFNENSNELTPRLVERLDQVVADIGVRQCNIIVTGYSSKQGEIATNALFAVERAQNALRYLQERGVKYIKASASGVGATTEFGDDFRSNRRVVITVTP